MGKHKPRKEYTAAYNKDKYSTIILRVPKDKRALIDPGDVSLNGYILSLITRDNAATAQPWDTDSRGVSCPYCKTVFRYDLYSAPVQWGFCPKCGGMIAREKDTENT